MHYNFDSFNKQNSSHLTEKFLSNRTVYIQQIRSKQLIPSYNRTEEIINTYYQTLTEQNRSEQLITSYNRTVYIEQNSSH